MEETLKTIAETYPNDPSTAGMTLAYLPDKKKYYASICRYLAKYGEVKQVVAKGMADTASQAAAIACDIWRKIVEEEKRLASTTISGPQG